MKFFLNPISFHLTGQTTPWIQRTNALSVINIMENKKMVLSLLKTVKTIHSHYTESDESDEDE